MSAEKPREGIYLDSALAVIGQQIDERIDELSRRRRRRTRVTIAALVLTVLASGSATAFAVGGAFSAHETEAQPEATVRMSVACTREGEDAGPFFTAEYLLPDGVDAPAVQDVCAAASEVIARDAEEVRIATPEGLLVIVRDLLAPLVGGAEPRVERAAFSGAAS